MIYILFGQCKSSNLYFQTHLHNTFRKQLSFNLICIKKGILINSFYKVEKCCCPLRPRRQERHGHGYQVGFTQQLLYLFSFLQLFLQLSPLTARATITNLLYLCWLTSSNSTPPHPIRIHTRSRHVLRSFTDRLTGPDHKEQSSLAGSPHMQPHCACSGKAVNKWVSWGLRPHFPHSGGQQLSKQQDWYWKTRWGPVPFFCK